MACGCSKKRKATAAALSAASSGGESSAPRATRRVQAQPPVPRVKTRARFRVSAPGGGEEQIFSTLSQARAFIDGHPGWVMDISRQPVE